MSELSEQIALIEWASVRSHQIPELAHLFAIPNGGLRAKKTAVDLVRSGTKSGVPDLFLPVPRGQAHGLWIELKYNRGKTTENQDKWLTWLKEQGYEAVVCYGWQEAAELIETYMGVPRNRRTEFFR